MGVRSKAQKLSQEIKKTKVSSKNKGRQSFLEEIKGIEDPWNDKSE